MTGMNLRCLVWQLTGHFLADNFGKKLRPNHIPIVVFSLLRVFEPLFEARPTTTILNGLLNSFIDRLRSHGNPL